MPPVFVCIKCTLKHEEQLPETAKPTAYFARIWERIACHCVFGSEPVKIYSNGTLRQQGKA